MARVKPKHSVKIDNTMNYMVHERISNGSTTSSIEENDSSYNIKADNNKTGIDLIHLFLTIGLSLLAWPICFYLNQLFGKIGENDRAFWMMIAGFFLLSSVVFLVILFSKIQDWLFYGCAVFAFTGIIDAIITLEFFKVIKGYMTEYLKLGEPYLFSSWGMSICLFDAVGFYFMYLTINFQLANRKSWRSLGIYWGSGLLSSMIEFLLAVFCGRHSPTPCTFLNVPYAIFPVLVLERAFARTKRPGWTEYVKKTFVSTIFDFISAVVYCISIWLIIARGLSALGCKFLIIQRTVLHEKALHLNDPAPFAEILSIVYLFYLVPMQILSLIYIFKKQKPQFLWELALIQAGAVLPAQFAYMVYSFAQETPEAYRVSIYDNRFWFSNLIILVAPHFLLIQLLRHKTEKQENWTPLKINKQN